MRKKKIAGRHMGIMTYMWPSPIIATFLKTLYIPGTMWEAFPQLNNKNLKVSVDPNINNLYFSTF